MPYHVDSDALLPTLGPVPGLYAGIGQVSAVVGAAIGAASTTLQAYFVWRQQHDADERAKHAAAREAARQAELAAAQAKMLADAQRAANVQGAITHQPPSPLSGIAAGGQQVAAALGSPMGLVAMLGAGAVVLLLMRR